MRARVRVRARARAFRAAVGVGRRLAVYSMDVERLLAEVGERGEGLLSG